MQHPDHVCQNEIRQSHLCSPQCSHVALFDTFITQVSFFYKCVSSYLRSFK